MFLVWQGSLGWTTEVECQLPARSTSPNSCSTGLALWEFFRKKAPHYRAKGPGVQGKRWPKYRYCFPCLKNRGGSLPSNRRSAIGAEFGEGGCDEAEILVSHKSAIGDTISCDAPYSAIGFRGNFFFLRCPPSKACLWITIDHFMRKEVGV